MPIKHKSIKKEKTSYSTKRETQHTELGRNINNQNHTQVFFGNQNLGMGVSASLGPKMLRDTLVSDQRINSEESRPVLNLSKQDLESLMAGKKASKKFLDQNRKELQ